MTAIADAAGPTTPGAIETYLRRDLPTGGLIEYEFAPAGWLKDDGEQRRSDWRAYYFTPTPACEACDGSGRAPSEKRPGGTVKCQPCNGTGETRRQRLVSVTTLLDGIVPKPGLVPWSEARGIEGAVQAVRMGEIGPDTHPTDGVTIVRDLRLGADAARDTAASRGINVHALLEEYMRTGEPPRVGDHPVEHHGYVQSLCAWLLKRNPEPEAVEELVADPINGFAGRRDLVARCGGVRIGWDAKTQERGQIYLGAHLQVKMYEMAAVVCGDAPCDELRVVVFPADGGEAREMPCEATDSTVDMALAYYQAVHPINALCEQWNRRARKERA